MYRLSDSSPIIAARAFELIMVMAERAGDFIRRRTTTDALPKIEKILEEYAKMRFVFLEGYFFGKW